MKRPVTRPTHFHKTLSEESAYSRRRAEEIRDELDTEIAKIEAQLETTRDAKLVRKLMLLRSKLARVEFDLEYQGADPKKVPIEDLKKIVRDPLFDDAVEDQYRARISNRATAIRAFCVECMGGQPVLVRQCASVSCQLWPFRMGKDPLRGFDIPKLHIEIDESEEDAEDAAAFEDTDEDDE